MKRLFVLSLLSLGILSACDTAKLSTTSVDDVYATPAEERAKVKALALEQEKQRAAERQAAQEAYNARQAKARAEDSAIANNPYYKDPQYSADDYYDYAYSARLNRFHNPIGVGYYDNYYTNIYSYSQNPLLYGTSIYSGYGCGMPSTYFGIGSTWGYGNSYYYDPFYSYWGGNAWGAYGYNYGYNSFWGNNNPYYSPWSYNPYYSSYWGGYNNGYWNGYNNGYWNGYNNGAWTYLNSYDNNSGYQQMTNAPRQVHTGGMRNEAGQLRADNGTRSYYDQVAAQQENRQRFSVPRDGRVYSDGRGQSDGTQRGGNNSGGTIINSSPGGSNATTRGSQTRTTERQQGRVYSGNRSEGTQMERSNSSQQNNNSGSNQSSQRSNSGGNSGSSNSGGGSAPRSSGSGGGGRPR